MSTQNGLNEVDHRPHRRGASYAGMFPQLRGRLVGARAGGSYSEAAATAVMKEEDIAIRVEIGLGSGKATVYTCDLTKEYVEINGDYRS